jgi:argininosuccinate lyase
MLLKSLPLAYNRDLQEDKLAVFDAYDTIVACLELVPDVVAGAELQTERIEAQLDDGFLDATALMEYLIQKGVPMRTGHHVVGRLVAECERRGCRLADLSLDEFRAASDLVGEDVYGVLGTRNAVAALQSYGSGGRDAVAEQLRQWQLRLHDPSEPEA